MSQNQEGVVHASVWAYIIRSSGEIDPKAESTYDHCLLKEGRARECQKCRRPTLVENLEDGLCPDCDGRSEAALREAAGYPPYGEELGCCGGCQTDKCCHGRHSGVCQCKVIIIQ